LKNILIVGGSGFLGYHLAKKCISKVWAVTSISRSKPKKIRFLPKVNYLILDISKKKLLEKKIKLNYEYIVNFGGYVNHKEKFMTYNSHFIGCKNLVDFFLNKKIKLFVQIGSGNEYGIKRSCYRESVKCYVDNLSTYSKSKLLSTNYLLKNCSKNNFPSIILRLYNIYGPAQDPNRVIPFVINGCLNNINFPCSTGAQYKDFLYIDDFTDLLFKCIQNYKNYTGNIFNVGSGKPLKIKKVINRINNLIKKGKPNFGKIRLRKDEALSMYANIKKAKNQLNWKPKIEFNLGIKKTINYYKKNFY
jgi:nucleoside-diphosphate-sugar epimerase